jgi:hypothetical protein
VSYSQSICNSCGIEPHFNQLSPEQAETLALIVEECAEVIQAVTKIQRHGLSSEHPVSGEVNSDTLQKEVGDLMAALRIGEVQNLLSWGSVIASRDRKLMAVTRYLHHAKVVRDHEPDCGCPVCDDSNRGNR